MGEPHSGHVLTTMLSLEHPAMPDEHTKNLNQVSQSHSLCHIGFFGKKEVYSSNHNSPRCAMPESFIASFPHGFSYRLTTAQCTLGYGASKQEVHLPSHSSRSHHSSEQRSLYSGKLRGVGENRVADLWSSHARNTKRSATQSITFRTPTFQNRSPVRIYFSRGFWICLLSKGWMNEKRVPSRERENLGNSRTIQAPLFCPISQSETDLPQLTW